MTSASPTEDLEFAIERWFPAAVDRVWAQCTTKRGLESWWSPEDLRTTVRHLDLRAGGEVDLVLRYVPALLGPQQADAFRAAAIPISLFLRGKIRVLETNRRLVFDLTLTLDRAGAGIETVTQFYFEPVGGGTKVRLVVTGKTDPHWVTLGKANLEGQLDRLGRSLDDLSESHS
jgi:uncharacterized protein YndB with AHSA1/START domain